MKKATLILAGVILVAGASANASTHRGVTQKFIKQQGVTWKWSDFQNIKQVDWESKVPKSYTSKGEEVFYLTGSIGDLKDTIYWSRFDVRGDKSSPKDISLQTGDQDGRLFAKIIPSLFNPANLKEIKSSCTRREYNPQSFYKWSKDGFAPLYVTQSSHYTRFGTYYNVYIHQSFDEMVENINNSGDGPLLMDEDRNRVDSCSFTRI